VDSVIRIVLAAFIVILCGFIAGIAYNGFIESSYRASLESSFTYNLSLSTDSTLVNATFFIPVPEDRGGNSPIIEDFSAGNVSGLPENWTAILYDTGKTTLVKITARSIPGPVTGGSQAPVVITLAVNSTDRHRIETADPIGNGTMFRPVDDLRRVPCLAGTTDIGMPECFEYHIPVYADYEAGENASVTITTSLTGRNDWKIFGPEFNRYTAGFTVTFIGRSNGWGTAAGVLVDRNGYYDAPAMNP